MWVPIHVLVRYSKLTSCAGQKRKVKRSAQPTEQEVHTASCQHFTEIPGFADFFSTKTYQQIMESYHLTGTQLYPFIPGGDSTVFQQEKQITLRKSSCHVIQRKMLIKRKEKKPHIECLRRRLGNNFSDRTHVETFFLANSHHPGFTPTIPTGQWDEFPGFLNFYLGDGHLFYLVILGPATPFGSISAGFPSSVGD